MISQIEAGIVLLRGGDVRLVMQSAGAGEILEMGVVVVAGEEFEDLRAGLAKDEVGEGGTVRGDEVGGGGEESGLFADGEPGEGVDLVAGFFEEGEEVVFISHAAAPGVAAGEVDFFVRLREGFWQEEGAEVGEVFRGGFLRRTGSEPGAMEVGVFFPDGATSPPGCLR